MMRLLAAAVLLTAFLPMTTSAQSFLVNDNGNLKSFPMAFDPDPQVRDYGIDQIDGPVFWDFFGTGAFYLAQGDPVSQLQPGTQVWHVNFPTKNRRQLTTGNCVPGFTWIKGEDLCGHLDPIAVSPSGHFAYIQQVTFRKNDDGDFDFANESQSHSVVIASLSSAEVVVIAKPASMSWSPNGEWLMMTDGDGLTIYNRITGKICDYPDITTGTQIQHIDWGPRNGGEVAYATGGNVWLLPLKPPSRNRCSRINTNKIVQLTNTDDSDKNPQWVGNFVAFTSNRASASGNAQENVWAVNPDSLITAVIATAEDINFQNPQTDWYGGGR